MKSLWQSFCDQAQDMADNAFAGIETLEDWTLVREDRLREFKQSLGLDPLPERCDPMVKDCGTFSGEGYTARRIGFRLLPDCWTSACVYYPDPLPAGDKKAPGILYVCGHADIGTWHYQHHGMLWARRGYVCMILDTVEQNDNTGEHHTYSDADKMVSMISLGFNFAGAEVWNAMRALDVLSEDKHVDPNRLAMTGQSGGGSCSLHTGAVDERVKAISSLCGISTPRDALINEHMNTHCECMYPYNPYRRDISEYAALMAPRPLLFCYANDDLLYHPDEAAALTERTGRIFTLYGEADRCRIVTCPGGHGNHPPFDVATSEWFDTYVAGEEHPTVKIGKVELPESVTGSFNGTPPTPNRTHLLPELMTERKALPLPQQAGDWPTIRDQAVASLPIGLTEQPPKDVFEQTGQWRQGESTVTLHQGQMQGVGVMMYAKTPDKVTNVVLSVAEAGEGHLHAYAKAGDVLGDPTAAFVGLMPRIAMHLPAIPAPRQENWISSLPMTTERLCRGMLRTGSTPVTLTRCDIAAAVDYILAREEFKGCKLFLYGRGDGGVACLYHALQDDRIAGVILEETVRSHDEGSPILGILRAMDIHHAVGLMAPRRVALVDPPHRNWTWPARVYERLGCPDRFIRKYNLGEAMEAILGVSAKTKTQ